MKHPISLQDDLLKVSSAIISNTFVKKVENLRKIYSISQNKA